MRFILAPFASLMTIMTYIIISLVTDLAMPMSFRQYEIVLTRITLKVICIPLIDPKATLQFLVHVVFPRIGTPSILFGPVCVTFHTDATVPILASIASPSVLIRDGTVAPYTTRIGLRAHSLMFEIQARETFPVA
jgi:hypothetical protein